MTSCPVCSKPVDPLRSRFVGVRDGKVVGFCSSECAAKGAAGGAQSPALAAAALAAAVDPAANPAAKAKPSAQTPATGVPRPATPAPGVPVSLESGPVIEIIREPATGAVATEAKPAEAKPDAAPEPADPAPDKTGRAKHPDEIVMTELWAADKAKAADARPASEPDLVPPRKSRAPLVILLLVVLAVGGFLVYQHLMKSDASAATKPTPSARAPTTEPAAAVVGASLPRSAEPPTPPRPPPLDGPAAASLAHQTLTDHLHDTSQRVQHLAATALARTADPAALAALAADLGLAPAAAAPPLETSDLAKLDLAYALARGGDARGAERLAAGLRSLRGDVRDEAARLLVLLGDARGVPHLLDLLQIAQRRLGAAEQLVHLREPHALRVLDQLRADPKTSADDRARATIALGVAGRADVAPALRAMLADLHESAFAARRARRAPRPRRARRARAAARLAGAPRARRAGASPPRARPRSDPARRRARRGRPRRPRYRSGPGRRGAAPAHRPGRVGDLRMITDRRPNRRSA
jgi:hypothetical protein